MYTDSQWFHIITVLLSSIWYAEVDMPCNISLVSFKLITNRRFSQVLDS